MDIVKQSLKNLTKTLSKKKKTDIILLETPKMQLSPMRDPDYMYNIHPRSEVDEVRFFLSGEYYFVKYGVPVFFPLINRQPAEWTLIIITQTH